MTTLFLSASAQTFPESFTGNWKGSLTWERAGKEPVVFTMRLKVQPKDSNYTWQIQYGDDASDDRPYVLKPVDRSKGHWLIDENNGLLLDGYAHANSFKGAFTVQGNTIIDNYRLENGKLFVEFISVNLSDKRTTTETVPKDPAVVDAYKINSYQSGWLTRE